MLNPAARCTSSSTAWRLTRGAALAHRLEPLQKRLFGGCHLTRPIPDLLETAGFASTDVDVFYEEGAPKPLAADSSGVAVAP